MATDLLEAEDFLMELLEPLTPIHNIQVLRMSANVFSTAVTVSTIYLNFVDVKNALINTFNRGYAKDVRFEVLIRLLNLQTHTRAFPIIKSVEEALVGKKPIKGCRGIEMADQRFMTESVPDGLWFYSMMFGFQIYD